MKKPSHLPMRVVNFTAVFQAEPKGGYTVTVPTLPGVVSYGDTIEEAGKNIQDAVELHIENLAAHDRIPDEIERPVYTRILNIELAR